MNKKIGIVFFLVIMMAILINCNSSSRTGKMVGEEKRIPLNKGGVQSGTWKTFDYSMNYQYRLDQEDIQQSGRMEFSGSLRTEGGAKDSLSIWIDFLDSEGKVLTRKSLFNSGHKAKGKSGSFKVNLEAPPGTEAMAFSHNAVDQAGRR